MQSTIVQPTLAIGTAVSLPSTFDYKSSEFNSGELDDVLFIGPKGEEYTLPCTYTFRGFYDSRHTYDFEVSATIFTGLRLRFVVHDWQAAGVHPIESY
jgi:hypothetical protein